MDGRLLRRSEWLALFALCAAYLEGGLFKLHDFAGAVAEMRHFGVAPAAPAALAVIALEIVAPLMILSRRGRWIGASALAAFTLAASVVADAFWSAAGPERFGLTNAFLEHLGLAGAFVLVACRDLAERRAAVELAAVRARTVASTFGALRKPPDSIPES